MSDYDLLVRAERAVLPDGERGCRRRGQGRAHRRGRGAGLGPRRTRGAVVELGLRRGAAARPRRHPRARQRPGPHRVGGLRDAPPGRPPPAGSRPSSTCRSTASRRPSTSRRWRSSARRPTARRGSTSGSGAVPSRATSRDLRPLHEAGVFGFKCFLLHSGVDEFPRAVAGRGRGRDARDRRVRRPAHRPRRGPRRDRRTPPNAGGRATPTSSPRGRGEAERPRDPAPHRAVPGRPAAASTSSTSRAPTRCR